MKLIEKNFFSDLVKNIRSERKLTQEQLGDLLGVGQNSVWQWERGRNYPHDNQLPKLAALTNYSTDELYHAKLAIALMNDGVDLASFADYLQTLKAA